MVSLYVCDFPQDLSSEALSSIFDKFDGFLSARCAFDRKGQRIAFVDYREVDQAKYAQQSCQGYRFQNSIKGINCRISDNSKRMYPNLQQNPRNNNQGNCNNNNSVGGSGTYQSVNSSESRSEYSSPQSNQIVQNSQANFHLPNQTNQFQQQSMQGYQNQQQQQPQSVKADAAQGLPGGLDMNNLNLISVQGLLNQLGDQTDPAIQMQVKTIQGLLNEMQPAQQQVPDQANIQPEVTHQRPKVQKRHDERPISQVTQQLGSYGNLFDSDSSSQVQSTSMDISNLQNASKEAKKKPEQQYHQQPPYQQPQTQPYQRQQQYQQVVQPQPQTVVPQPQQDQSQIAQTLLQSLQSSDSINALTQLVESLKPNGQTQLQQTLPQVAQHSTQQISLNHQTQQVFQPNSDQRMRGLADQFPMIMQYPKNATKTVYVEGLPHDTTEREIAHIFRPYPGFKQLRLVPRETKDGHKVHFCFADFETVEQTTIVVNTLQGYRFHKDDIIGLQFSFAVAGGSHHHQRSRQ